MRQMLVMEDGSVLILPSVGRLSALDRAGHKRARKRWLARKAARAQRKHLTRIKGKKAVRKMLAYNRRPK